MNAATATTVRKIQSLTWLIVLTAPLVACADEQSKTPPTPKTGYAEVNGLKLYYEIHGESQKEGTPLVLLHGGQDLGADVILAIGCLLRR